jgi:hypothetical protein
LFVFADIHFFDQALASGKLPRKKLMPRKESSSSGFVLSEKPIPQGEKHARKRPNHKSKSKREKAALRPRRRRRNPLVRAALEPSDLLAPVVPDDFYETKAEAASAKELKLKGMSSFLVVLFFFRLFPYVMS